jgi:hypothetical protein
MSLEKLMLNQAATNTKIGSNSIKGRCKARKERERAKVGRERGESEWGAVEKKQNEIDLPRDDT